MSAIGPAGTPGSWGADPKGSSAARHARRSEELRNLKAAREGSRGDKARGFRGLRRFVAWVRRKQ